MVDMRLSKNSPVSVTIGAVTYTGVVLVAMKIQGVDGGPMVKSRTVANNHAPIGVTDFPKEMIVVVTLDADILPALIAANYVNTAAANTALSAFVITERNTAGQTRTVTFVGANSKIQSVQAKNANLGDQIHELTILTHTSISYSNWA